MQHSNIQTTTEDTYIRNNKTSPIIKRIPARNKHFTKYKLTRCPQVQNRRPGLSAVHAVSNLIVKPHGHSSPGFGALIVYPRDLEDAPDDAIRKEEAEKSEQI